MATVVPINQNDNTKNTNDNNGDKNPKDTTSTTRTTTTHDSSSSWMVTPSKGTRLEIWWPDDERYYAGHVVGIRHSATTTASHNNNTRDDKKGPTKKRKRKDWKIRYDDGEVEWLDFRTEKYRVLSSHNDKDNGDNDDNDNDTTKATTPVPNDTRAVRVGSLVSVWWEYYSRYYPGIVKRIRTNRTKPFYIQYDDGDARWEDLATTKFFLRNHQPENSSDDDDDDEDADPFVQTPRFI